MFFLRLSVIALFLIMLLPGQPDTTANDYGARANRGENFCDRYPNTCAAAVELFSAFKNKLSYGIGLARRALDAYRRSAPTREEAATPTYDHPGERWDRGDTVRPPGFPYGTLSDRDRSGEWRGRRD